jgi:hypothetical protein
MNQRRHTFTSELVSEGHLDKVCDYVADSSLDAYLAQKPWSAGEISSIATADPKPGESRCPMGYGVRHLPFRIYWRVFSDFCGAKRVTVGA